MQLNWTAHKSLGEDGSAMIGLDITGHRASIHLNNAPVNAINEDWIEQFNRVLDEVEADNDVSIVHIKSTLKTFCAGADLSLMRQLLDTPKGRDAMIDVIRKIQKVFLRLETMAAVTIAEIGGAALGGGLELALACDLRVAADSAKLGLPEASLGLLPGAGGTQRLPRICGDAIARRLILGAEVIDGRQAAELGLVQWVVPGEELSGFAADLTVRLGALPGEALKACKRCIDATNDSAVDGYGKELRETRRLHDVAETQELIQAFLGGTR